MPNANLEILGKRLVKARYNRGFTQDQLSDKTGLTTRHIGNIENGLVNPSFGVLSTLMNALGISYDYIFAPADEQVETDIQEIAGLYRACPEQGQKIILAAVRAMGNEMMNAEQNTGTIPQR